MATSGTRTFSPDLAEFTIEAFERCLIRPQAITSEHVSAAIRSANFMLADWATQGFKEFELVASPVDLAVTDGVAAYTLPAGTLDIWHAVLRTGVSPNFTDDPMFAISRSDYEDIPVKATEGRPQKFFVDRSALTTGVRTVRLWPVPDRDYTFRYVSLKRPEDVTGMAEEAPIAYEWTEAFVAGLAYRLASKYAPTLKADLLREAQGDLEMRGGAFARARRADRDRSDLRLTVTRGGRGRIR